MSIKTAFFDAIIDPQSAVVRLAGQAEDRASLRPGLIWLGVVQAVFTGILLGITIAADAAVRVLATMLGPEQALRMAQHLPAAYMNILDVLGWGIAGWLGAAAGLYVGVLAVDAWMRKQGDSGGLVIPAFNLAVKLTVPWRVFLVIPVLGAIVMFVGSIFNLWRVLGQLYPQRDTQAKVLAVVIIWICSGIVGLVATRLVGAVL